MDKEFHLSKFKLAPSGQCYPMKHRLVAALSQRPGQNSHMSVAFCKTEAHFPVFHFIISPTSCLQQVNRLWLARHPHQIKQIATKAELCPRKQGWKDPNPKLSSIGGGDKAAFSPLSNKGETRAAAAQVKRLSPWFPRQEQRQ